MLPYTPLGVMVNDDDDDVCCDGDGRHQKYRQAFSKLQRSFSDLKTDRPFYLRLGRLKKSPAGNQYVVTM